MTLSIVAVLMLAHLGRAQEYSIVEKATGQAELTEIVTAMQGNYGRITTMRGIRATQSRRFEDWTPHGNRLEQILDEPVGETVLICTLSCRAQFAADLKQGKIMNLFMPGEPPTYQGKESGKAYRLKDGRTGTMQGVTVVLPDRSMVCVPSKRSMQGRIEQQRCTILPGRPGDEAAVRGIEYFDPADNFRLLAGNNDFYWDYLTTLRESIETAAGAEEESPRHLRMEYLRSADGQRLLVRQIHDMPRRAAVTVTDFVCDKRYRGNVVCFSQTYNGKPFRDHTLEYADQDGICYPSRVVVKVYNGAGEVTSETTTSWEAIKINEPLPEEMFTLQSMGLQEGDVVVDLLADKQFIWRNGALAPSPPEVEDYLARAKAREASITAAATTQPTP